MSRDKIEVPHGFRRSFTLSLLGAVSITLSISSSLQAQEGAPYSNSSIEGAYAFRDLGVITAPESDGVSVIRRTMSIGGIEFDGEANSGEEQITTLSTLKAMDLGEGWGSCNVFDIFVRPGDTGIFRPHNWCIYKVDPEYGIGTIVASLVNEGCSSGDNGCNSLFKGRFVIHSNGDGWEFFAEGQPGGPGIYIGGTATRR